MLIFFVAKGNKMERLPTNEIVENEDGTISVILDKKNFAIVDKKSYDKLSNYRWYAISGHGGTKYAVAYMTIGGYQKVFYMHRLCAGCKKGLDVDHIDRDGLNNRTCNLRTCTRSENLHNGKIKCTNTSGHKGVFKKRGRWMCQLSQGGSIYSKSFPTKEEAIIEYEAKAKQIHGPFYREK